MFSRSLVVFMATALFTAAVAAQTILPLNTGYDYSTYSLYPTVGTATSTTQDQYWINIASYPTTSPAVGPAYVLQQPSYWSTALPASHWISAWNQALSQPGVTSDNPGYTIYRKCFCLAENYRDPQISFTARSDDTLQVWVNSHLNTVLLQQFGGFNGPGIASLPSNPAWFHAGLNCLYALVEDTYGGAMGFDLDGSVQAFGLSPQAALGVDQTFDCGCRRELTPRTEEEEEHESEVLAAIIRIAEQRRLARTAIPRLRR